MGFQQRLLQTLEQRGELDRAVEFLPDDMAIADRMKRSQPFTRPELAVLLAYAKLSLYAELLEPPVPDEPYLVRELLRYFGGLQGIKAASLEELMRVPAISRKIAEDVYAALHES